MSQLHLKLKSLELVGRSGLDLLAHSLVRPLLHAVESLADIHFGGIVVVCLLEKSKVECDVSCVYEKCSTSKLKANWRVWSVGNEGKYWREGHCH
jgi:hypothetical protein